MRWGGTFASSKARGREMDPITDPGEIDSIASRFDHQRLMPVYEAVKGVRGDCRARRPCSGFAGLLDRCHLHDQRPLDQKDQATARLFAYRHRRHSRR